LAALIAAIPSFIDRAKKMLLQLVRSVSHVGARRLTITTIDRVPIDLRSAPMSTTASSAANLPSDVPKDLIVDFDVYAPSEDATDFLEACVDFQQRTPHRIVWSPHHNGHWVPTRGQDVFDIYADHERFSSKYYFIPATDDQSQLGAFT
jgi:hypothetical protein